MKKRVFFLLAIVFSLGVSAQEEKPEQEQFHHWSLDLRAGINEKRDYNSGPQRFYFHFTPAVSLEYTANPRWGLGVNYTYLPYGEEYSAQVYADGLSHEFSAFASVNLSNLLAAYRSENWQKLNVYTNLGGGYCFYEYDNQDSGRKGSSHCLFRYADLTAEYDVNRLLAVGMGIQYRIHHTANMRGDAGPITADFQDFYMAHLSLRYKFGGNDKSKRHIRNVSYLDYERARKAPEEASCLPAIENLNKKVRELQDQVDDLSGRLNGHVESTNKAMGDLEQRLLAQAQEEVVNKVFEAIRFDFDSDQIRETDLSSLNELSDFLKEHPTWRLRLSGHADGYGAEEYNQLLSERRAAAVKSYLVNNKGLDAGRILIDAFGDRMPVAPNTTPEGRQLNRRVEVDVQK